MRGLFRKSWYEVFGVTLVCGVGLLLFEILFAFVIQTFGDQFTEQMRGMWETAFFQNILRSFLGSEFSAQLSPSAMKAMSWVHPVVLALIWTHAINLCTRVPAGEVDRGTVDVLLSLPVSRLRLYLCDSLVWWCGGGVVLALGIVGYVIGHMLIGGESDVHLSRLLIICANSYCIYLCVGALALFVSGLSDRRGRAIAVTFGIVLASFFLNFLAQFWTPAKSVSFLSVLHYFQPLPVLDTGAIPWGDMLVLTACAAVLWIAGAVVFVRRDICTV